MQGTSPDYIARKRAGDRRRSFSSVCQSYSGSWWDHVIFIGKDAFARTPWYRFYSENETDWKEDFLFIGKVLVKARRNLRKAIIPKGTVMIAADAFYERVLLYEAEIPSSVKYIGWRHLRDAAD